MTYKCQNCGKEFPETPNYCTECGQGSFALVQQPPSPFFPGAKLPDEDEFLLQFTTAQGLQSETVSYWEYVLRSKTGFIATDANLTVQSGLFLSSGVGSHEKIEPGDEVKGDLEIEIQKKSGTSKLNVELQFIKQGDMLPTCFKGSAVIEAGKKADNVSYIYQPTVQYSGYAMVDRPDFSMKVGADQKKTPPKFFTVLLRYDAQATQALQEKISQELREPCPYCRALTPIIHNTCIRCDRLLPEWFRKDLLFLCEEYTDAEARAQRIVLRVHNMREQTRMLFPGINCNFGRLYNNHLQTCFHDEKGNPVSRLNNGISRIAGTLTVRHHQLSITCHNTLGLRYREKEFRKGETQTVYDSDTLVINNGTEKPYELALTFFKMPYKPAANSKSTTRTPYDMVAAVRIDDKSMPRVPHFLLPARLTIGSGSDACIQIQESKIEQHHASLIYYRECVWLENCSKRHPLVATNTLTGRQVEITDKEILRLGANCDINIRGHHLTLTFCRDEDQAEGHD